MKIVGKLKRLSNSIVIFVVLTLIFYTWLVTPRRFGQCLTSPLGYLTRRFPRVRLEHLPRPVTGNHVRLLVNGDEALPVILAHINGARESIRWQVMLFNPDETGRELADALAAAARRGVQVQLSFNIDQTANGTIADGFSKQKKESISHQMQAMLEQLRDAGVDVRDNPAGVDFVMDGIGQPARVAQEAIQAHACVSANHYDHRKLLIIDNRWALVGGMNVGKSYLYHHPPHLDLDMVAEAQILRQRGLPEGWEKWLDTSFTLEGPVVESITAEFNWKWEVLGGQPLPEGSRDPFPGGVPVEFLRQRPGLPEVGARFFELVDNAQEEIYVASPFVSYIPALEALQAASQRGVRVVFVYPNGRQEMALSGRIFRKSIGALVESGVELYFNDLRMAHTKLMVVDGRQVLFGSFNLNHRSFRHDLEVAALVEDKILAAQVIERVFKPYLQVSSRVLVPPRAPWNPIHWIIEPFS